MMDTSADRLRQARRAKGYRSASAAARALGIPVQTFIAHENGNRGFGANEARRYARAFGVTAPYLLLLSSSIPAAPKTRTEKRVIIIEETWVHEAVAYLRDNSHKAALAKGNLIRAEYHRKRVRAKLILESDQPSQGLREAYAESHPDYAEICEKLAKCEEAAEWHRNERSKSETICEMWRTQSATIRGLGKL